jgi:hypothetical protein
MQRVDRAGTNRFSKCPLPNMAVSLLTCFSTHLTIASLYSRMWRLSDAKEHTIIANSRVRNAGKVAEFSWVSCYAAYRAGCVAMMCAEVESAM